MRVCRLLPLLLLAACADDGMTRTFSMSRNSAPETAAGIQMPLSAPPGLGLRPVRPSVLSAGRGTNEATTVPAGSLGQDALVQAAGPPAEADIRAVINENAGMVYPPLPFVDQMMSWAPPPGYAPMISPPGSGGGWLSRMF